MRPTTIVPAFAIATLLAVGGAGAAQRPGPGLEVLVAGQRLAEHAARGAVYVEALRGREYTLRLTNPLPVRVAVALAVDGLNTIDARRSDAGSAAKWVLEPFGSAEISGWQVSDREARAFFFTGERGSYGAWLGRTEDLGVIEAVFYRERVPVVPVHVPRAPDGATKGRGAPGAAAPLADAASCAPAADEYAATGIGERRRHEVVGVHLDLEPEPAARVRLRYEYRPELERLGVLAPLHHRSPLDRRERARGFDGPFCPEPPPGR